MTSRERVKAAVSGQIPDRVPVDLGSTRVTGIQCWAYKGLVESLGLPDRTPRVYDLMQMLAEVDDDVIEAAGLDCVGVFIDSNLPFGLRPRDWKPLTLFDGTEILVPGELEVFTEPNGDWVIREGSRPDGRVLGRMPRDGHYFDYADDMSLHDELTLPDLSGVPSDQAVYLTDLDTGKKLYARTMPSYSFAAGAGGAQRHFELTVQPKGADNLVITSASVQPTGAGAVVTYSVSRPCQVSVEVLNIAGRPVRSLVTGAPAPAGSNVQTWDLRSDDGTLAPSGQYLVRIEAVADNGQRVQALRPLHVAR